MREVTHRRPRLALFAGVPKGKFACIAVDPPWLHQTWSENGRGRSPRYRTMTLEALRALPIGDYASPDAFLLLWITGPFLAEGVHIELMRAWGFTPSAMAFVWLKTTRAARWGAPIHSPRSWKMGMGKTTRQNAEFVILGRRGKPRRLSAGVRQEIIAPAREHSRKPELFYERAEAFAAGPRLDVFGRQKRQGWTVVGDQANLFKEIIKTIKRGP